MSNDILVTVVECHPCNQCVAVRFEPPEAAREYVRKVEEFFRRETAHVDVDIVTCRECGRSGSALDEFVSPYSGLCVDCSRERDSRQAEYPKEAAKKFAASIDRDRQRLNDDFEKRFWGPTDPEAKPFHHFDTKELSKALSLRRESGYVYSTTEGCLCRRLLYDPEGRTIPLIAAFVAGQMLDPKVRKRVLEARVFEEDSDD